MYYSQDFNRNNLFQKFNGWYQGATRSFNENHKDVKLEKLDLLTNEYMKLKDI